MPFFYMPNNETNSTLNVPLFTIEWSEYHYYLFSHLICNECPRELAEGLELGIFQFSPSPNTKRMDECIKACHLSSDEQDLNDRLTKILVKWTDEDSIEYNLDMYPPENI